MGTNYFAIPKITEAKEEFFQRLAKEKKWQELRNELNLTKSVHIGKSSVGWQFIFNHNNWEYFQRFQESIQDFINSCDLIDEYDDPISHENFWNLVDKKREGLGITPETNTDFYVGDLLFSSSTNFS